METTIHKTMIRPWGKETLVTVYNEGIEYNYGIDGDLTENQIISIAEQMVIDKLSRDEEEVTVEELIDEKETLISEIAVLQIDKATLIAEKEALIAERDALIKAEVSK